MIWLVRFGIILSLKMASRSSAGLFGIVPSSDRARLGEKDWRCRLTKMRLAFLLRRCGVQGHRCRSLSITRNDPGIDML
ncbi:uncharacterized protein P884DRAFT_90658 [Thermothelomyces heterothallicus CBS 202.75]|uniref:uncharacterized protein n=1 Tax=Thermothelomyces heterothallicus CBS 202.75 TaxID=1149848 RepID=UPI00374235D8